MSIYGSSSSWGGNCSASNQSPINLSQSFAKPCDLLCELVFEDAYISSAAVSVSNEGLVLQSTSGLGSCKFNGEGYTCQMLLITHPSHHTVENIQADVEVVAVFKAGSKVLCVSALARVNPAQSSSTHFFNSIIPYANSSTESTMVNLGDNWGLFMMIPTNGSYYVYDGSLPVPDCDSAKYIVFKTMINIDPNDFALLTKNVTPGSRPIQGLGDREVFFNDTEQLPGGPIPHDNKTYMRCKRSPRKGGDVKKVTQPDVSGEKSKKTKAWHEPITGFAKEQIAANGVISVVDGIILILSLCLGVGMAYYYYSRVPSILILNWVSQYIARWIRSFFVKSVPDFAVSKDIL
jgi:carbonic anhydrase